MKRLLLSGLNQKYHDWIFGILFGSIAIFNLNAQSNINLLTNWDYQRDEHKYEKINQVIAASNGYIIAVGEATGDSFKDLDGLFLILDPKTGKEIIRKKLGGLGNQSFNTVVQHFDGTFLVAGYTEIGKKKKDGYTATLDLEGNVLQKHAVKAGNDHDEIYNCAIGASGRVLAVGRQHGSKGGIPWLVKIINGVPKPIQIDFSGFAEVVDIAACPKGGFILVGNTGKKDLRHPSQIWVMKVDADGEDLWGKIKYFGDQGFQEVKGISQTISEPGFLISGTTNTGGNGMTDMWLINLDRAGTLVWEQKFGGPAADVGCAAQEISKDLFAIFGYTWSHMPRARNSTLQLMIVDRNSQILDKDTYPIVQGEGDEIAFAMTHSPANHNLVIVGNASSNALREWPTTYLSAVTYQSDMPSELTREKNDVYGSNDAALIASIESSFIDANLNHFLEANERGYIELRLNNASENVLEDVTANLIQPVEILKSWNPIYIGAIPPRSDKTIRIPVQANGNPEGGTHDVPIKIYIGGKYVTSHTISIHSNNPSPANLIVNNHHFSPQENPKPNEPVLLTIDISNIGGTTSAPVEGFFTLPSGVASAAKEHIQIPSLKPRENHTFGFNFSIESFHEPLLKIIFETPTVDDLVGIKKTFTLPVESLRLPERATSSAVQSKAEIYWVSHEGDRQKNIDVTSRSVDIKAIALSNAGLKKNNFAVLINGKRTQGQKLDESVLTPPTSREKGRTQQFYTSSIKLAEGTNQVQIVYLSEAGTEIARSSPLVFNFYPKDKPNLYVLSIGVAHGDLQYTVNDAKTFANIYAKLRDEKGRGFKKVEVKQLVSSAETTENNIKRAFVSLSKNSSIKDNDLVVVFISSHGKVRGEDQYVLLPSDYDPQYEELTTIDFKEDILKKLRMVDGNKLVFIDACHSGSAGSRSFSDAAASKVMSDLIHATAGLEIFASCGDHEFSYEDPSWGNGAFTKAIIEAFENQTVEVAGKKVNADIFTEINGQKMHGSDGVITIEELKLFVQQRVPFLVKKVKNKSQNPVNKSTELLPRDMGIYMVTR